MGAVVTSRLITPAHAIAEVIRSPLTQPHADNVAKDMPALSRNGDRALVDWALSLAVALYIGGLMQVYMPLRRVDAPVPGVWVMALLGLS